MHETSTKFANVQLFIKAIYAHILTSMYLFFYLNCPLLSLIRFLGRVRKPKFHIPSQLCASSVNFQNDRKMSERIMNQELYCMKINMQATNISKHNICYSDTIEILTEICCVKTKGKIDIFVAFLFYSLSSDYFRVLFFSLTFG